MNRSHLWKFLIIVFILVWSILEMMPPTSRDLLLDRFHRRGYLPGLESRHRCSTRTIARLRRSISTSKPSRDVGCIDDEIARFVWQAAKQIGEVFGALGLNEIATFDCSAIEGLGADFRARVFAKPAGRFPAAPRS